MRNGKLHFPSKKVKNNEKDYDDEKMNTDGKGNNRNNDRNNNE